MRKINPMHFPLTVPDLLVDLSSELSITQTLAHKAAHSLSFPHVWKGVMGWERNE